MKDGYSFHHTEQCLDEMYQKMHDVYTRIFQRCGLRFRPVEADSGAIGGSHTHEFHVLADSGEDAIASCQSCDYAANLEKAACVPIPLPQRSQADKSPQKVSTPGCKTIAEVAKYLSVDEQKTLKALVYTYDTGSFAMVVLRGDTEVNEAKLKSILGADLLAPATEAMIENTLGLPVGYIGPVGLKTELFSALILDSSRELSTDMVGGALERDYHLVGIDPARDMPHFRHEDVGFVEAGATCPVCSNGILRIDRGIEVGQIFKLGTKYSDPMGLRYLDENGKQRIPLMGTYGIGVGRTAAAAIEQNHDADGIIWPAGIAPYHAHIVLLDPADQHAQQVCSSICAALTDANLSFVVDDRNERPGVKFKDADLLGMPLRITIGARGLKQGCVEVSLRRERNKDSLDIASAPQNVVQMLQGELR